MGISLANPSESLRLTIQTTSKRVEAARKSQGRCTPSRNDREKRERGVCIRVRAPRSSRASMVAAAARSATALEKDLRKLKTRFKPQRRRRVDFDGTSGFRYIPEGPRVYRFARSIQ